MNQNNYNYGCSTSFIGVLTVIFVLAKLFGIVTWPWWLVFAPLWISFTVTILVIVIIVGIGFYVDYREQRKN